MSPITTRAAGLVYGCSANKMSVVPVVAISITIDIAIAMVSELLAPSNGARQNSGNKYVGCCQVMDNDGVVGGFMKQQIPCRDAAGKNLMFAVQL